MAGDECSRCIKIAVCVAAVRCQVLYVHVCRWLGKARWTLEARRDCNGRWKKGAGREEWCRTVTFVGVMRVA